MSCPVSLYVSSVACLATDTPLLTAEVLTTNNRLKHLYKISDLYDEILAAAKGEVKAKITTAQVRGGTAKRFTCV